MPASTEISGPSISGDLAFALSNENVDRTIDEMVARSVRGRLDVLVEEEARRQVRDERVQRRVEKAVKAQLRARTL
jgi:hypothetical protein